MRYTFTCFHYACCGRKSEINRHMTAAERLMNSAPDSSLHILDKIHIGDLSSKEQKARYALLKSMALDKNFSLEDGKKFRSNDNIRHR